MDRDRILSLSALLGGLAAVLVYHALGAAVVALVLFAVGAAILAHSLWLVVRGGGPRVRPLALTILACGSFCYAVQMVPSLPFAVQMAALGCGTLCLLTAILIARLARTADPHRP
jgi:hypothetical protein